MPGAPDARYAPPAASPVGREADRAVRTMGQPGYLRISGIGHCVAPVTQANSFNAGGATRLVALTHRVSLYGTGRCPLSRSIAGKIAYRLIDAVLVSGTRWSGQDGVSPTTH